MNDTEMETDHPEGAEGLKEDLDQVDRIEGLGQAGPSKL